MHGRTHTNTDAQAESNMLPSFSKLGGIKTVFPLILIQLENGPNEFYFTN